MVEAEPHSLASLIALLPDSNSYHAAHDDNGVQHSILADATVIVLPKLRKAADGCPACMMAALRQAKIPLPMVEGFNFTEEMKSIWADINEAQAQSSYSAGCY